METHATELPFYRLFEIGSPCSLRNSLERLRRRLEILPSSLLEALNAELSAILYDFDIAVANWLVLAASVIGVSQDLVEVGEAETTALDEVEVVKLEDMFIVFLDDKAEVLDLTFDLCWLRLRARDLIYR